MCPSFQKIVIQKIFAKSNARGCEIKFVVFTENLLRIHNLVIFANILDKKLFFGDFPEIFFEHTKSSRI
jgi:hypothetical protein